MLLLTYSNVDSYLDILNANGFAYSVAYSSKGIYYVRLFKCGQ